MGTLGIGETLAIGGGLAALSGGMSVAMATRQNQAIQQSMNVNARNAAIRQSDLAKRRDLMAGQILDQRRMAQLQQIKQANAVLGRARATAAMSGQSTGSGSAMRNVEQVRTDRLFNQMMIDSNARTQLMGVNSQYTTNLSDNISAFNAMMAQLAAESPNPWLTGAQGAISGFGTGLQISGGINAAGQAGG